MTTSNLMLHFQQFSWFDTGISLEGPKLIYKSSSFKINWLRGSSSCVGWLRGMCAYENWIPSLQRNDCQHEISGKVDVHDLVPRLKQTHVFESWIVCCGSKNGHHKDMCWQEIEIGVLNLSTILDVMINPIGGGPNWSFWSLKGS
jgi:hypothetical protein